MSKSSHVPTQPDETTTMVEGEPGVNALPADVLERVARAATSAAGPAAVSAAVIAASEACARNVVSSILTTTIEAARRVVLDSILGDIERIIANVPVLLTAQISTWIQTILAQELQATVAAVDVASLALAIQGRVETALRDVGLEADVIQQTTSIVQHAAQMSADQAARSASVHALAQALRAQRLDAHAHCGLLDVNGQVSYVENPIDPATGRRIRSRTMLVGSTAYEHVRDDDDGVWIYRPV